MDILQAGQHVAAAYRDLLFAQTPRFQQQVAHASAAAVLGDEPETTPTNFVVTVDEI